jgi:putative endonuclease
MPLFARMIFGIMNLRARRGLSPQDRDDLRVSKIHADTTSADEINLATNRAARRTGVRGETFAYWYLRKNGYVIVSRNFMVPGMKGEIDLAGYDGKVLAFIEVKTRTSDADEVVKPGERKVLPEDAMNAGKRHSIVRMAKMFMVEWRLKNCDCRFDVLAIESQPGKWPVVRLHKDCFGISGRV